MLRDPANVFGLARSRQPSLSRDSASDLLCCANVLRPAASPLTSLRRASHWQDLAGLVWGKARLLGFCAVWGGFYRLKVLLASMGCSRAAITFIVTTLLPLQSLESARRALQSIQRGWMHAEWAISVYPLLRAHLACTHQQPVTNYEWRSNPGHCTRQQPMTKAARLSKPTQPMNPSAARDSPGKTKRTNQEQQAS